MSINPFPDVNEASVDTLAPFRRLPNSMIPASKERLEARSGGAGRRA